MADSETKLDNLIDSAERIGVIGSPSSTSELSLDVMAGAVSRKLVGELALFRYLQDNCTHYSLGQITEITLRNVWHEDPTLRSLIRQRGRIDAVSERQDTHQGQMTVSAVFASRANGYVPSMLGTVPATGTSIHVVDDNVLNKLLAPYQDQLFYLGRVYGSRPLLPLWFKHFDRGPQGAGEAYHLGIFGKTGSGKSVLAKAILLAYARHRRMGLIVFDPQGEFSMGMRNAQMPQQMGEILSPTILQAVGRHAEVYDLKRIQLDGYELLRELLVEFGFFFDLGIKASDYQEAIADYVEAFLRNDKRHKLAGLGDDAFEDVLDCIRDNIQRVYGTSAGIDRVRDFIQEAKAKITAGQPFPLKLKWDSVIRFFRTGPETRTPWQIIQSALSDTRNGTRPIIIIDLSQRPADIAQNVWDEKIKPLLIDSFLGKLIALAEKEYRDEASLNTLVVLDEAHRFAPQGGARSERFQRVKSKLVDAVRTTRKYGLGWMFLSQTLSSLDSEVVQQLRISFFGFGLSMGTEFQKLRELVGGQQESIRLYQRFRDPQSSFDVASKEYSFMTIGPVSPLSFSGTPLFFNAFTTVGQLMAANQIVMQRGLPLSEP